MRRAGAALLAAASLCSVARAEPVAPGAPDAGEIARRAAELMRGPHTTLEATLRIVGSRRSRPRELAFRRYDDRESDRTLVRILPPGEHAGMAWLKLPPNLWSFTPGDGRRLRLPWAVLREPWMESALTIDDLVHGSSELRDYEPRLLEETLGAGEHGDRRAFVLEYLPREGGLAAWGRIVASIDAEHATPLRKDFYDRDGALVRSLRLGDVREAGGRRYPHLWTVSRPDAPGSETRLRVDAVRFDASFDPTLFSTRSLGVGEAALHSPRAGGDP